MLAGPFGATKEALFDYHPPAFPTARTPNSGIR